MNRKTICGVAAGTSIVITTALATAGPLNPPAGPVASTPGPEPRIAINATNTPGDANSVFRITQPGSYYLTGNVAGVAGKHGIEIAASAVTIDLMGFDVSSTPGNGAFDGVSTSAAGLVNLTIFNGTVRGWGDDGIDLAAFNAQHCEVRSIRATANADQGVILGNNARAVGCTASGNTAAGIRLGDNAEAVDCVANSNLIGIAAGSDCRIFGCRASANTTDGISAVLRTTIDKCLSNQNAEDGVEVSHGSTITASAAADNAGNGFRTGNGVRIEACTARENTLNGIAVGTQCAVDANTCTANGIDGDGAGILASGSDSRITGNTCIGSDRGIDVNGQGNFIARNVCTSNTTNWDITNGNVCLIVAGTTGGPISGNAGGVAPGSTDPNANFTY